MIRQSAIIAESLPNVRNKKPFVHAKQIGEIHEHFDFWKNLRIAGKTIHITAAPNVPDDAIVQERPMRRCGSVYFYEDVSDFSAHGQVCRFDKIRIDIILARDVLGEIGRKI